MKSAAATIFVLLAVFLASCDKPSDQAMSDADPKLEELSIETEEGTVIGHTTEVDDFPKKVVPVNGAESREVAAWESDAETSVNAYGTPQSDNELRRYDKAFKARHGKTLQPRSIQIRTSSAFLVPIQGNSW